MTALLTGLTQSEVDAVIEIRKKVATCASTGLLNDYLDLKILADTLYEAVEAPDRDSKDIRAAALELAAMAMRFAVGWVE